MTNQEKKAWLRRYRDFDRAINQKLDEQERLRALCERVTPVLTGSPKGSGMSGPESGYAKLVDCICEIHIMLNRYVDLRHEIEDAIEAVPDERLQELLHYRYIEALRWDEVARRMDTELRWIFRLHGRALEILTIESH